MEYVLNLWPLLLVLLAAFIAGKLVKKHKVSIHGVVGEKAVAFLLGNLDPEEYKVYNDLMLNIDGKTVQIDHVVVSDYGVFVIETKNYRGDIYGNAMDEEWTQSLFQNKNSFHNPLRQNYGHVMALRTALEDFPELIFYPIVVFTGRSRLHVTAGEGEVIYLIDLVKTIRYCRDTRRPPVEKFKVFARLEALAQRGKGIRQEHVERIKKKRAESEARPAMGHCPKCGGALVIRDGKNGFFRGCSNYPECNYTTGMDEG